MPISSSIDEVKRGSDVQNITLAMTKWLLPIFNFMTKRLLLIKH